MKPIGLFPALALALGCSSDRPAESPNTEKRVIDDEYATLTMTPAAAPLRSPGGDRDVARPGAPTAGTRSLDEGVDLRCPMNVSEADAVVSLEPHGIALLFRVTPNADDEAILRWNACVRTMGRAHLSPRPADVEQPLE